MPDRVEAGAGLAAGPDSADPPTAAKAGVREAGSIAVGQVARAAGQIGSLRAATSILQPAAWGVVAQAQSGENFFFSILVMPVWLYCVRAFFGWSDAGTLRRNLDRFVGYTLGVALAGGMVAGVAQIAWHPFPGTSFWLVGLLIAAWIAGVGIATAVATSLNLMGARWGYALVSSLPVWLSILFAVLFTLRDATPTHWIAGIALGWAACALSLFWLYRLMQTLPARAAAGHAEQMPFSFGGAWAFAWPQVVTAALWWIHADGNRFLLAWLSGPRVVGLFVAAYQLGYYPVRMTELVVQPLCEPRFFRRLGSAEPAAVRHAWEQYAGVHVPAMILAGVFTACAGPLLARVLLGPQYQVAGAVVFLPAIAETFRGINYAWYLMSSALTDLRLLILPVGAGAVTVCGGIVALSRIWDPLRGSLAAMALATFVVLVCAQWQYRRRLEFRWPWRMIGLGLGLSAPMAAALLWWNARHPAPTLAVAVAALVAAGIYLALAEMAVVHVAARAGGSGKS